MMASHFKTVDWMIGNINPVYVNLKSDDTEQSIADIEKFWVKNVDSDNPFQYNFIDKNYKRTHKT